MIMTAIALAGALAQSAAPTTAVPTETRLLKNVPNTTISYFDVAGRNGPAIEKSLKKILSDPAQAANTRLYNYNVAAQITKATTGTKCVITNVKATLTPTVHLPRLAEEARVPAPVLAKWRTYVSGVESDAAANLWYISDHMPALEKSVVGLPCDQANPVWNAGLEKLKTQVTAFNTQRAAARKVEAPAPATLTQED